MRFFLKLSFDGTEFHGWQIQQNALSVQAVINQTLKTYFKSDIPTTGCGRTDTGVHAREFYLHFDADIDLVQKDDIIHSLNCMLPYSIAIQDLISVKYDAHARFDAIERSYEYSLHQFKNPFLLNSSLYFPRKLNFDKMNEAAALLLSNKDFACFSKSGAETRTTFCDVRKAVWIAEKDQWNFRISADRFLRNMVRAIVGTLMEVGEQKISIDDFQNILLQSSREEAGPSVPAHGLALCSVLYPYISR